MNWMLVEDKVDVHSTTSRQENVDMYFIYMVSFETVVYRVMSCRNEEDNYSCLRDES